MVGVPGCSNGKQFVHEYVRNVGQVKQAVSTNRTFFNLLRFGNFTTNYISPLETKTLPDDGWLVSINFEIT